MGDAMKKIEKGDWIKCHSEADLKNWLAYLSDKGIGAVASPGLYILITAMPDEDEKKGGSSRSV